MVLINVVKTAKSQINSHDLEDNFDSFTFVADQAGTPTATGV